MPAARAGLVEQWLVKDEVARRVRPAPRDSPGAREARTRWRVLAVGGGRTLLCFEPLTGRPHQLRAAAASLGTPLLGDVKYGAKVPLANRSIALHALALAVEHPTRGEPVEVRCAPSGEVWLPFATDIGEVDCSRSLPRD
jgi:23S rRNA pseudouridine1911/1915/1917 synthase